MGGGSPNSSPPVDVAPGGGLAQYDYTGQFGNALGSGVSAFGKGYASGSNVPMPQFAAPSVSPYVNNQTPPGLIQQQDPEIATLLQAFQRIGMI
jgi:hypothetical protein